MHASCVIRGRNAIVLDREKTTQKTTTLAIPFHTLVSTNNNLYIKDNLLDPSFLLMMLMPTHSILSVQMTPISHVTSFSILSCLVGLFGHGTSSIELLLHDRLG